MLPIKILVILLDVRGLEYTKGVVVMLCSGGGQLVGVEDGFVIREGW